MGPYALHDRPNDTPGWLHWLALLIVIGTAGVVMWYAASWVVGPFSWLVETVIPVWFDHHCIHACGAAV